jgi:hypothetical protein
MSFSVSFQPPRPSEPAAPAPEEAGASYETFVIEACGALAEVGDGSFHLGGFGDENWPVDVAYDMSAFVEQLPELLAGVREGREVEIDLYPPGIERTLMFRPAGSEVTIHCHSRTDWVPDPEVETIGQAELITMLSKLAEDFATALNAMNPRLAQVEPFAHWLLLRDANG